MKKNLLDPADDDFGTVLICAVRYCIGRQTYMPSLVIGYITPMLPNIEEWVLRIMRSDIAMADNKGDKAIDEPLWLTFWQNLDREIKRREHD